MVGEREGGGLSSVLERPGTVLTTGDRDGSSCDFPALLLVLDDPKQEREQLSFHFFALYVIYEQK